MLKKITNPLILIPFLTICSASYHMSYWSEFGLNGLSFISLADIIKSAAQPMSVWVMVILVSNFVAYFFCYVALERGNIRVKSLKAKSFEMSVWYLPFLLLWLIVITVIPMYFSHPLRWIPFSFIASFPIVSVLVLNGFLADDISDFLVRTYTVMILVLLPILSYSMGKIDAGFIERNIKYQYTIGNGLDKSSEPDTLKLLGFTTDNVIFSTLENDQIYILERSIDTLMLRTKKNDHASLFFD